MGRVTRVLMTVKMNLPAIDESDVMRPVNSLDDYTSFLLWGTDFDDKNNI